MIRKLSTELGKGEGNGIPNDLTDKSQPYRTKLSSYQSSPNDAKMQALKLVYHQVSMNKLYIDAITTGNFVRFNTLLDENRQNLSLINIITVLFHFAKYRHKHLQMALRRNDTASVDSMYLGHEQMEHLIQMLRTKAMQQQQQSHKTGTGITGQSLGNLFYSLYGTGPHATTATPYSEQRTAQSVRLLETICDCYLATATGTMKPKEIANALYGLQNYSGDGNSNIGGDVVTRRVYALLTPIIDRSVLEYSSGIDSKSESEGGYFSSQDVGLVLYGLKSNTLTAGHLDGEVGVELQNLMAVLARKIAGGPYCTSSQSIGSALFGLRNLSSDLPVVRAILSALNDRICAPELTETDLNTIATTTTTDALNSVSVSPAPAPAPVGITLFNAQNVSNSLYGLQSMSAEHPEVRAIMSTLARVINNSITYNNLGKVPAGNKKLNGQLSKEGEAAKRQQCLIAQHVGNSLYGLQNMSSNYPETRALLSALAPLLKTTDAEESILPRNIDNALFGLKNMRSKHKEVRRVLSLLDIKIHSCCQQWNCENIARAMYGLQNMSSSHAEVRDVVASLTVELSTCSEVMGGGEYGEGDIPAPMSCQSLGNMLAGLQCMSSDQVETREFINALLSVCSVQSTGGMGNDAAELLYRQLESDSRSSCSSSGGNDSTSGASISTATSPASAPGQSAGITSQNVGMALYGLQNMTCINNTEVVKLLGFLTHWIETGSTQFDGSGHSNKPQQPLSSSGPLQWLDSQAVSTSLYGLQQMPSCMPEVSRLLDVLTDKINSAEAYFQNDQGSNASDDCKSGYKMTELDVGRCLYGLQNMSDADPAVTRLCAALLPRIGINVHTGTGTRTGVRNSTSSDNSSSIKEHAISMSMQSIASSFYGLRNMTTRDPSVRALTNMLVDQLRQWSIHDKPASTVFWANVLYGMQNLVRIPDNTDDEAADREAMIACSVNLLSTVNDCMRVMHQHGVLLSMLQTGKSLNGILEISDEILQRVPSSCTDMFEVLCRSVESHTASILAATGGGSTAADTNAGADCTNSNERDIDNACAEGSSTQLKNYQIASLYQSLLLATHFLSHLTALDDGIKHRLVSCRNQLHEQLHTYDQTTGRYVCVLPVESTGGHSATDVGVGEMTAENGVSGEIDTASAANNQQDAPALASPLQSAPNSFERPWIISTKRLFAAYPDIVVESRCWLHGFEADIVITVPTHDHNQNSHYNKSSESAYSNAIINVELDGPHHQYYPHKQRFTRLRDEYLQQRSATATIAATSEEEKEGADADAAIGGPRNVFVVGIPYQDRVEVNRRVTKKRASSAASADAAGVTSGDLSMIAGVPGASQRGRNTGRARGSRLTRPTARDVELENWRQRALWYYIEPVLAQFYDVDNSSSNNSDGSSGSVGDGDSSSGKVS